MDRSAVTQRVWELAEPLALTAGLELVDVHYRSEGGRQILRLLIDRPDGGVTLDQLTAVSRELGDVLDGHDAVPGRYHLECSSPGLNRPLVREGHFRRAVGQQVRLRTRTPIGDRCQFRGRLVEVTAEGVRVNDSDVAMVTIPFLTIEKAHTEYDFSRPTGRPHAPA